MEENIILTDEDNEPIIGDQPPLAQFGTNVETVPGLLAGVELVKGLAAPEVRDGLARIPTTSGGGESSSIPLAQFNSPYQPDTTGTIAGIVVAPPSESKPSIQDGSIRVPLAHYTIPEAGERPGLIKGAKESEDVGYIEIHEGIIVHPNWVPWATYQTLLERVAELENQTRAYAPAGVYDAVNARHLTWEELKDSGVVTLSRSTQYGFGIKAFMIGDSLSLFIEE